MGKRHRHMSFAGMQTSVCSGPRLLNPTKTVVIYYEWRRHGFRPPPS
jgi:hypothetical protein